MLYFSACGTRSGILCYIFLRVECAFIFCVLFSDCGTLSGILGCNILRMEFTLGICVKLFCMSNVLWYFVLHFFFCGIFWYCEITCYIFPRVEFALIYCVLFSAYGIHSGIFWYIFLHVGRTLVYLVLFFYVWNAL